MIEVDIVIQELPTSPGKKRGSYECRVRTTNPTEEEISALARLFEKIREIAHEIGEQKGGAVKIIDINEHVRPKQSEGDRGTDQDRQPQ